MPADAPAPRGDAVYLDHAAATPLRPEVAAAMREAADGAFANPSSPHAAGRRARAALEDARERVLAAIGGRTGGGDRDRLVFTSGATEANRLAVLGSAAGGPGRVAWSPRDHAGVAAAARGLAERGWEATLLTLDRHGSIANAADAFVAALPDRLPAVLCVTPVCGQTGIREWLGPWCGPVAAARSLGIHVDATQAVGLEPVSFRDLDVSTLAFAPHKFGGPRGIGGLVVRGGVRLEPVLPGPQELGLRGGTEAVALAVGFATALELAVSERAVEAARLSGLRNLLERRLLAAAAAVGRSAMVIGASAPRAPHMATIAIAGIDRQSLVMAADLAGVCIASGTACSSGSSEPSAAVAALGLEGWVPQSAVRVSLGRTTTEDDVLTAAGRLERLIHGLAMAGLQSVPHDR